MPKRKKLEHPIAPPLPPAKTPEGRENQLVNLAMELVEQRMRDGTASSQEVVHFLKLGSMRERLERAKLEHETALLEAKTKYSESLKNIEELTNDALKAFKSYSPSIDDGDHYDDSTGY